MRSVRLAVIGVGGMGEHHCRTLATMDGVELTAVCDIDRKRLKEVSSKYEVPGFENHRKLLDADLCDAVLIATPHYDHPPIAIDAFRRGRHVLCEKPLGAYTLQALEALEEHRKHPDLVFSVMFQMRTAGHYKKLKDLVRSGEVGRVLRVVWIDTEWFRSQAYYDSGGWRATWIGEGGGVLINQCPHALDLLQWILGMPRRLCAFCSFGKYHDIEVEDDVTAYLEWENGATGVFMTSTGETPGTSRQEITGTRGKIVLENRQLTFYRNRVPADEFIHRSTDLFAAPETWTIRVPTGSGDGTHSAILRNFVNAILSRESLLSPAEEGLHSLALANAMILSTLEEAWVEFPLDDRKYKRTLDRLRKRSCFKKRVRKRTRVDMESSFHS